MKLVRIAAAAAAVGLLALAHARCQSVPLLAPPGSSLTLLANPTFIASHGGVSRITALVVDGTGAPVADGTVVMFFTNLGRIDERGTTNDGVAQVNLISDARSGVATVSAVSGGGSLPTASPSPSPVTGSGEPGALAHQVAAFAGTRVAAADNSDTVEVTIGNARVEYLQLRAEPARIGNSRSTTVIATVFDGNGNPVSDVPVYFRVTAPTSPPTEFFDRPGPVYTNTNGEAITTLSTRRDFAGGSVTFVAEAPGAGQLVTSNGLTIPVF